MYFESNAVKEKMNEAGKRREPFLFVVDFEQKEGIFIPNPLTQKDILFNSKGISNEDTPHQTNLFPLSSSQLSTSGKMIRGIDSPTEYEFMTSPEDFSTYQHRFKIVMDGLKRGDSYLTNLTIKTPLQCSLSLESLFQFSNTPYKLYHPGKWVCFSPECFVQIEQSKIKTYPMKGTIDARIPDAATTILNDPKETAEHNTIVDLLRNDLSRVATSVTVNRFRYIEKVDTHTGPLLQVSSEIEGTLADGYLDNIGSLVFELLPAGSVLGAPKESTLYLISQAEQEKRGFYTGVAGYFDGNRLESFVLIRFIEQDGSQLYFRSGGGVTANSDSRKEYEEAIRKVYLPF